MSFNTSGDSYVYGNLKFTPKVDNVHCIFRGSSFTCDNGLSKTLWNNVKKGTEYTITFTGAESPCYFVFVQGDDYDGGISGNSKLFSDGDLIAFIMMA